ncbi:sulfite exporter TauE/SafE family protein [Alphaproteobacteria bacterium KMM 3653]|uniref:Probable membrane transporter protein n=1 Tax=Harenicola maris TaxID=2841044 RepID=A0AAP2G4A3_9RHOB|nr:sulfite exporter TauE/SafE family protein [Harenicola maris]
MPEVNLLIIAAAAVFFAGVSKGGFGSAASFAAAPILSLVMDPRLALGVMLPLLMLIDIAALKSFWGKWHTPTALAMCIGALPGVALGVWFFRTADADTFRLLIGAVALGFVAYQIPREMGWLRVPVMAFRSWLGFLAGMAAGFTSFVAHAGGPPAAIFMLSQGMRKTVYQATSVVTFWVINMLKLVPYALLGAFTEETLVLDLWLFPVALIGTWVGVRAHYWVPERAFFALTYFLLVCTGCKLLWEGLT